MIRRILTLFFGLSMAALGQTHHATRSGCSGCEAVTEALAAANSLKTGMKRKDIEKAFSLDGGMVFRDKSVYIFRKCPYLKLEVRFAIDPLVTKAFSDDDAVENVSRLYVDFPARD